MNSNDNPPPSGCLASLVIVAVVASILFAMLFTLFHHGCNKGHYELVHVPQYQKTSVLIIGKVIIPQFHTVYAHDEQRWVCDDGCGGDYPQQ